MTPSARLGGPPELGDPVDRAATLASVRRKLLDAETTEQPTLSRHVLLRRIGSGGFGIVFEAYDPDLDRKVAIKLLKRSRGSRAQRSADLRAEAQSAAKISHPNVIAVHDVGTYAESDLRHLTAARSIGELPPSGVFVVMELVEGSSLSQWAGRDGRRWPQTLDVLRQAGAGLAAAHAQSVIHRDFKPSNVLVGGDARTPRARVVDFGLAMPAETSQSSGSQGRSADGAQVMGTPAYIAPEIWGGDTPSEASDQFSFCVCAWEVLAGARPFNRPVRDPAQAAAVLARLGAPTDTRVPARVWKALRRGLEPDPARRHASMDALLRALRDPPSTWRRAMLTGLSIAGAAAVTAFVLRPADPCEEAAGRLDRVWTPQAREALHDRITRARPEGAEQAWATASATLDAHASAWSRRSLELCTARRRSGSDSVQLTEGAACLQQRALEFERTLDVLVEEEESVAARVVAIVEGLQPASVCDDPSHAGPPLPPPGLERAEAMEILAELERAEALFLAGQQSRRSAVAAGALERAIVLGHGPTEARARICVAGSDWDAERVDEALAGYRQALLLAERSDDDATSVEAMIKIAGMLGRPLRQREDAARMLDWAEARADDPVARLKIHRYRGVFAFERGEYDDAIVILDNALRDAEATMGPQALFLSSLLVPLGNAYSAVDQAREAAEVYRRALAIRHRALGSSDGDAMLYNNLGVVLRTLGEQQEACAHYERALGMFERTYGSIHGTVGMALNNVGSCLSLRSEHEEALAMHRRALEVKQAALADCRVDCGYSLVNLGDVLLALQRPEEALREHEKGLASWSEGLGPAHPRLSIPYAGVAEALLDMGRAQEARVAIERGLAVLDGPELPEVRLRLRFLRARARPKDERAAAMGEVRALLEGAVLPRDQEMADKMKAWLRTANATARP